MIATLEHLFKRSLMSIAAAMAVCVLLVVVVVQLVMMYLPMPFVNFDRVVSFKYVFPARQFGF